MKLDATDEKIIAVLTEDARTSNREVARIVGLSDTGVRKRLKRLNASGAAKVTAVVHPASAGLTLSAFVRLQTSPAVARKVAKESAKLDSVSFVALASGRFNVIVLVLAHDERELGELIHNHFRCWEGVHTIETVRIAGTTKHSLDLILIQ